jgi:hypothetical protein
VDAFVSGAAVVGFYSGTAEKGPFRGNAYPGFCINSVG